MNVNARRATVITVISVVSIVIDQITKYVAKHHLEGAPQQSYLGDLFKLVYIENHGAFLGLGGSLPEWARTLIFTVLVSAFLIGLTVWALKKPTLSNTAIAALSLVIGGGIGNLIDRLVNNGGVMDFMVIDFTFLGPNWLRTGIFNVADVWIVIGAILLFVADDFRKEEEEETS